MSGFCVAIKYLLFFIVIVSSKKKGKDGTMEDEDKSISDADVFCKNESRLIRMEKADEVHMVDSVVNSTILLQCKYCEEKDNGLPKLWNRQKHIFTGNITEIEPDMNNNVSTSTLFETKDHSLVIRRVQEADMGLYFCRAPYTETTDKSFNYLIDLSTKGPDEIVGSMLELKNYTTLHLMVINSKIANKTFTVNKISVKMRVFTDWADWSECDTCFRKEGLKTRLGRCRVKPICEDPKICDKQREMFKGPVFNEKQNVEKPEPVVEGEVANVDEVKQVIMEFGIALACRSLLLKTLVPDLFNLTADIPDYILNEKCTSCCRGRSTKKGPRYKKSIILAKGAHLTLVCPDSTIDSDVRWEHNKIRLHPNEGTDYIPGSSEPRLYIDSFNTLYLFEVSDKESGNFTCFVDGVQMQEIKIIILTRSLFFTKEFTRHLKYLGFVFFLCFVGYIAGIVVMFVKNQARKKERRSRKKSSDKKRLLKNRSEESDSESDSEKS